MKKVQHVHLTTLVKTGLLLCLFLNLTGRAVSQNNWDHDSYQQQFRTSGKGTGTLINWTEEAWETWVGNATSGGWVALNGHPPLESDINSTYIEIQKEDKIVIDGILSYKNDLTLWVCGELHIGTLSLMDMVPSVVLNPELIVLNHQDLTISLNAEYYSETALEGLTGFYIAPAGAVLKDPAYLISSTGVIHDVTPENHHFGIFNSGILGQMTDGTPFQIGQIYQVIAFAGNSTGVGYSVIQEFQFEEATDAAKENEPVSETDEFNGFNRIRIWICPGGKLTIETIQSKNNALLHIDGALTVENFDFNTNNYCITGTGSISTSDGQAPPIISGKLANKCPGFNGILPIELLAFNAVGRPDHVKLSWSTASETNNDYFTIERSRDLLSWDAIGYKEGAGNSHQTMTYHLEDRMPWRGMVYYRLKQTDFDGHSEVFEPVAVQYEPGLNGLNFTVTKNHGQWIIHLPGSDQWQVEAFTPNGRKLFSGTAIQQFTIPDPQQAVVIRIFNGMNPPVSRIII